MATCTYIDLFTGADGLGRGLRQVIPSARPVVYVEREVSAALVLAARAEEGLIHDAPIWSDVATFNCHDWRSSVDFVIGGFPCQPYSTAGRQLAERDERDLWPHITRILNATAAPFGFFENVGGSKRHYESRFAPELWEMGYYSRAVEVSASACGAPHQRKRVFILATHATSVGRQEPWEYWQDARRYEADGDWETSDALDALGRGDVPVVCRDHDGMVSGLVSRQQRLKMLGNGVVPKQTAVALTRLATDMGLICE